MRKDLLLMLQTASVMQRFGGLAGSTIVCGVIALVVRILVVIAAVLVIRSFNKGLKQKGQFLLLFVLFSSSNKCVITIFNICMVNSADCMLITIYFYYSRLKLYDSCDNKSTDDF